MPERSSELRRTPNGKMEVVVEFRGDSVTVLYLRGDVDMEGAALLKSLLEEQRERSVNAVVLNASGVEKICSAGLSILIANNSLSLLGGPKLLIARLSKSLRWALEQLGTLDAFSIFEDVDSAIDSIT